MEILTDEELIMKFPKHHQMTIMHNEHHTNYEKVEEYLERLERYEHISISEEDKKQCINLQEIWQIHWYSQTPIGFHCVGSYSLERCLEIINKNE